MHQSEQSEKQGEIMVTDENKGREIKMMDTITFAEDFQPVQWIFTDLLGKI